jgi:hypothetical protein
VVSALRKSPRTSGTSTWLKCTPALAYYHSNREEIEGYLCDEDGATDSLSARLYDLHIRAPRKLRDESTFRILPAQPRHLVQS